MTQVGYLISVTTSPGNGTVWQRVYKIAGIGQVIISSSDEKTTKHLFIVPGNRNGGEIQRQLEEVPGFQEIQVRAWYHPARADALAALHKFFEGHRVDSSGVSDGQLSAFIHSNLEGIYAYYLDFGFKRNEKGLVSLHIRPLEEHPEFSPDWLKERVTITEDMLDEELVMETVEIELGEDIVPPAPPPPPPPNLGQMTDSEIKDWLKRNYDSNLDAEDIEIIRRSNEVEIIFNRDEGTGTWICPLNKSSR